MFIVKARLILISLEKVLLLLQTTEQGGKYTLVGGRVESKEYVRKALIRECYEEVGIRLLENDLELVHVLHKKDRRKDTLTLYYTAETWTGFIESKEPEKFKDVAWFPIRKLPAKTSPTTRHVIEKFLEDKRYSELRRNVNL